MSDVPQDPAADLALVRAVLAGDAAARDTLARQLDGLVRRMIGAMHASLRHPLDEHALADVVQETQATVWEQLADYRGLGVFAGWVYRICMRQLPKAIRRRSRAASLDDLAADAAVDVEAARLWRQMLVREQVERALAVLGGVEADAVRLRHLEELSFEEMAARQGIGMSAAKARYYRAMVRLEEIMRRQRGSEGGAA